MALAAEARPTGSAAESSRQLPGWLRGRQTTHGKAFTDLILHCGELGFWPTGAVAYRAGDRCAHAVPLSRQLYLVRGQPGESAPLAALSDGGMHVEIQGWQDR
jgi:hypothetical protein